MEITPRPVIRMVKALTKWSSSCRQEKYTQAIYTKLPVQQCVSWFVSIWGDGILFTVVYSYSCVAQCQGLLNITSNTWHMNNNYYLICGILWKLFLIYLILKVFQYVKMGSQGWNKIVTPRWYVIPIRIRPSQKVKGSRFFKNRCIK